LAGEKGWYNPAESAQPIQTGLAEFTAWNGSMGDQADNEMHEQPDSDAGSDAVGGPPEDEGPVDHSEDEGGEPIASGPRIDPVRVFTALVLAFCIALFVWHLASDRFTPYTSEARVATYTVPIAPQISAYVTEVLVVPNERVEEGQILVQLDRKPFELAVQSARAALAKAGQEVGARTASVDSAAAVIAVANARLERARRNYDRVQRVSKKNPGALSEADRDRAATSLEQAKAELISAKADLERAKQRLGATGPENPMIESAVAAVDMALYNLSQTTVAAPGDGWIGNLQLDVGHFAAAGQPLMSFISAKDAWIEADMRENNLLHIEPGDPVEILLDVAPGRVFHGAVRSVGVGVSTGQGASPGELPVIEGAKGWLRDPQRFPVYVSVGDDVPARLLRTGGQANVVVYTGDRPLLNTLGRWRIRLVAWLSYVW